MRMVRKDVGGGMRPGWGPGHLPFPSRAGKLCPQAHCPAHLQTLSSLTKRSVATSPLPQSGWHGGSQQEVLNKSLGQGMDGAMDG